MPCEPPCRIRAMLSPGFNARVCCLNMLASHYGWNKSFLTQCTLLNNASHTISRNTWTDTMIRQLATRPVDDSTSPHTKHPPVYTTFSQQQCWVRLRRGHSRFGSMMKNMVIGEEAPWNWGEIMQTADHVVNIWPDTSYHDGHLPCLGQCNKRSHNSRPIAQRIYWTFIWIWLLWYRHSTQWTNDMAGSKQQVPHIIKRKPYRRVIRQQLVVNNLKRWSVISFGTQPRLITGSLRWKRILTIL